MLFKKQTTKSQSVSGIGNMHEFLKGLPDKGFTCKNVLDVGAHECTWSKNCVSIFENANYFLIEPQVEMKNGLEQFCTNHPGSQYKLVGLGSEVSTKKLSVWEDKQGSSFVPGDIGLELDLEERLIEMTTINELVSSGWLPVPDLVKIDVQGYEKEVIEGASAILGKTELIIMEVSLFNFMEGMDIEQMLTYMRGKGYVMYDIAGFNNRQYDQALGQIDVAFAREDGILRSYKKWQ